MKVCTCTIKASGVSIKYKQRTNRFHSFQIVRRGERKNHGKKERKEKKKGHK
jgi:hypothetical protein